ncbi:hypothetical protein T4D_8602 [Trichinella pseudospiralis]|uniref:Uncharacterized protein n=1 Tax=Trichinella pseudospiralis TaxID=6337 RepID=A0A0V1DNM8_TRIPS|nr:hypothetical protein T4D_8602 [Trichinella pseudospiralis]
MWITVHYEFTYFCMQRFMCQSIFKERKNKNLNEWR